MYEFRGCCMIWRLHFLTLRDRVLLHTNLLLKHHFNFAKHIN